MILVINEKIANAPSIAYRYENYKEVSKQITLMNIIHNRCIYTYIYVCLYIHMHIHTHVNEYVLCAEAWPMVCSLI